MNTANGAERTNAGRIPGRTRNSAGPAFASQLPKGIAGPSRVSDTKLGVDDAQREGLADGLRAVQHVQFAQRLLHVVLHGERADLEDQPIAMLLLRGRSTAGSAARGA